MIASEAAAAVPPTGLRTGAIDVLTRIPLIVMMFMIGRVAVDRIAAHVTRPPAGGPLALALDCGQDAAFAAFALAVCVLAVLRLAPLRKARGLLPRAAAMTGAFLLTALAYLPKAPASPEAVKVASLALLLAGNAMTAYGVVFLGRSFSIMPEARRLVTAGPYGIIRHPLYVAEAVATLGSFLMYRTWPAAAVCVLQVVLQLARIGYEEAVLCETFPEYRDYARRVPRFLPRLRR